MAATEVVNVKVKYIRPQGYDNLKEWMADEDNLYIGRRGIVFIADENGNKERWPKQNSPWANPFKVNKSTSREEAKEKYREYITRKITDGEVDLSELEGKRLGCWCKEPGKDIGCHGDVLVELLEAAE